MAAAAILGFRYNWFDTFPMMVVCFLYQIRHDNEVFNVQSTNWEIASLVYHTGSETKKNDKKIKQTDQHNKSEKQSKCKKAVQG